MSHLSLMHFFSFLLPRVRALTVFAMILGPGLLASFVSAGDVSKVEAFLAQLHAKGDFNGNVLIADANEIQLHAAYGLANEETKVKLEPGTPHRIASVTKGFTAVLALQAVERQEMDLDEPMLKQFPEVSRPDLAAITLRQLLTHSSGLVDFAPELREGEELVQTLARELSTAKVESGPGEKFAYANINYTVIGCMLERATGKTYAELLTKRILQPAGMTSTYLDIGPARDRSRATGYEMQNNTLVSNDEAQLQRFLGAGGIVSTTEDLYWFSRALAGGGLLSANSLELMQVPQHGRYAMGCVIMKPPTGGVAQLFLGSMAGTSAVLARFDDGQRTIVLLSNRNGVPTNRLVPEIYRLLTTNL
jgi:CubicO group peptidase (beta-lactamase class C family)